MGYKLIFNPFSGEFEFVSTNRVAGIYPVNYVSVNELTLPSLGSAYAPDSYNVTDGNLVLFTNLSSVAARGVYKATVVAGKVTKWTRVIYGQSPSGESTDGDMVVVANGLEYSDHTFQCTDTATATWLNLGVIRNYWVRIGNTLYPDFPDNINLDNGNLVTNGKIGIGITSPTSSLEVGGSFGAKVDTISNNITLTDSHSNILVNRANTIITVPNPSGIRREYTITNISNGDIDISCTYLINDEETQTLSIEDSMTIYSTGATWRIK